MPSGEHPFDGDMILIKNKNKNPSVSTIYTSEAGRYLAVYGMKADPSGLVRPLPLSSTHLRLVLIPLGSLEARVSDHLSTTRYLETLEYRQ